MSDHFDELTKRVITALMLLSLAAIVLALTWRVVVWILP